MKWCLGGQLLSIEEMTVAIDGFENKTFYLEIEEFAIEIKEVI